MTAAFAYAYFLSILGCFVAAVWTGDLRFLGTGLILIVLVVLVNKMGENK